MGLKYAKNALAAGTPRQPPDPLVGWGGNTPPRFPPPRRLRRFDSRAFGAQLLWPQCKILATHMSNEVWSVIKYTALV